MEKATAALCSHGQQAACVSNRHRQTDIYSTHTHKYTARHTNQLIQKPQQAPETSSNFAFWPIEVLVGNTHICIYVVGIPPELNLGTVLPVASDPASTGVCKQLWRPRASVMRLGIPWKYLWSSSIHCSLCVWKVSFLSHNLTKSTILVTMKELEMYLSETAI